MQLYKFTSLPVPCVPEQIYKRLGFRDGKTQVSPEKISLYEQYLHEAISLLELKGVAARFPILRKDTARVELAGDVVFESKLLATLLKDSDELLCMAVTAGSRIIESIRSHEHADLTRSVVYDATASEMVDGCFDWIQKYVQQELRRENKQLLPKRISCGYSDFSLSNQLAFFELLRLDSLDIAITKSFMLVPEKSATAVTGISTTT